MKTFTIEQARSAAASGGVLSANLRPLGSVFTLEFKTRNGSAMLIASVSKEVRRFVNPIKAFEIVRELGLEGGHYSVAQWRPDDDIDRQRRPDRSLAMKKNHEAVELKRVLDERIQEANKPDAVWMGHDEIFDSLEAKIISINERAPHTSPETFTKLGPDGKRDAYAFVDNEHQGKRFGMLTISYRCGVLAGQRLYKAVCDCGVSTIVPMVGLERGDNISCGCQRGLNNTQLLEKGQRFNMLTVIEKTSKPASVHANKGHYYRCLCDCGKEYTVSRYDLTTGARKSCGCLFNPNLQGKTFGRLQVVEKAPVTKGKAKLWECKCSCGGTILARGSNLSRGKVKSCGCIKVGRKPKEVNTP